jgi:transposase-like protein
MTDYPKCPLCKRRSHTKSARNAHTFYCHHCLKEFEDLDDGDVCYGRPSRRLEREERRRKGD